MLSHPLHASFADASEQRASDRRVLRLEAAATTPGGEGDIQIHNLSRTGMLVRSAAEVAVGADIEVELPGGARHGAQVVWREAELFGCRFVRPLSQATLSAALLRAAPLAPASAGAGAAIQVTALARLRQHWNFEHEAAAAPEPGLPPGKKLWAIIGLGLLSWAIPSAVIAWMLG